MSVESILEIKESRTCEVSGEGTRYTRSWLVLTTGMVGPGEVAEAVETIGDTHPDDSEAICIEVSAQQDEYLPSGGKWTVNATYSTHYEEAQNGQNPLARPPKYSGSGTLVEQPTDECFDSKGQRVPIVNFAGDPYSPALTVMVPLYTLDVEVNLPGPFVVFPFIGKVNKNGFGGLGPGQAMLTSFNATGPHVENGIVFYVNRFGFTGNPRGFQPRVLNAGLREVINDNGTKKVRNIMMPDGTYATSPIALDDEGRAILTGTAEEKKKRMTITEYKVYQEISFAPITF